MNIYWFYDWVMASIQLEQQLAEEKKRAHSLTDVMRKPTRVVLLKVGLFPHCILCISTL